MNKYKGIKINGKKINEHRLVMEKHLGRKLTKEEVVHHIDRDKSNNVIDNLILFPTKKAHTKFHYEQGDLKLVAGNNKKTIISGKLRCIRCGDLKPINCFQTDNKSYLGVRGFCKLCENTRRKNKHK